MTSNTRNTFLFAVIFFDAEKILSATKAVIDHYPARMQIATDLMACNRPKA
jgi:hypothetical protein